MADRALSRTYFEYDVFLNFRGPDTRDKFTGYLYHFLQKEGIRTFLDSEKLQMGEKITESLVMAIKGSRIAITVFSENYASSSFCLDELVHILNLIKGEGRCVLPVFYHVEPSDLRYQRGIWGAALEKHEKRLEIDGMERLNKWKMALQEVAEIKGASLIKGREEVSYVKAITEVVVEKINRPHLRVTHMMAHQKQTLILPDAEDDTAWEIDHSCGWYVYTGLVQKSSYTKEGRLKKVTGFQGVLSMPCPPPLIAPPVEDAETTPPETVAAAPVAVDAQVADDADRFLRLSDKLWDRHEQRMRTLVLDALDATFNARGI